MTEITLPVISLPAAIFLEWFEAEISKFEGWCVFYIAADHVYKLFTLKIHK